MIEQFDNSELRFVLNQPRSKRPIGVDGKGTAWNKLENTITYDEIAEKLNNNNLGVLMGQGDLICIDTDRPGAEPWIRENLPATLVEKTGSSDINKKHFYYYAPEFLKMIKATKNKGKCKLLVGGVGVGDFLFNNCQVICAPSIHETDGNMYRIVEDREIATLGVSDIEKINEHFKCGLDLSLKVPDNVVGHKESVKTHDLSRVRCVDLVDLTKLRKTPSGYQGSHPIHGSTTGRNFVIDDNKDKWFCHGCGAGGDALSLYAVTRLGKSCNNSVFGGIEFVEMLEAMEKDGFITKLENKENKIYKLDVIGANELLNTEFEPFSWCVEDIVPETGVGIISGSPGSGKTWISLLQACCISSGKPWFGFKTEKKRVLYIDEENVKKSIQDRLNMIKKGHGFTDSDLENLYFMSNQGLNVDNDKLVSELRNQLELVKPSVVYIDMLDNVHEIKNENDAGEVNKLISKFKELVRDYDISFILLTHTRKPSQLRKRGNNVDMSDIRGSSVFGGRADFILVTDSKDESELINIYHRKARYCQKVPGFTILMNKLGYGMKFEITDKQADIRREIDKCSEDILKLLQDISNSNYDKEKDITIYEPVKRKGIEYEIELKGHSKATIGRALERLLLFKKIRKPKQGLYCLIDKEGKQTRFKKEVENLYPNSENSS